jgi:hypothetical protein
MPINSEFSGLKRVHADPDVYVIENFLDRASCADLIECAKAKKLALSPVAYAGWTKDVNDLLGLAAKGPVSWLSIGGAWLQTKDESTASVVDFFRHAVPNYLLLYVLAAGAVAAFLKAQQVGLQSMRTSTSTTLSDLSDDKGGAFNFVSRSVELFGMGQEPLRVASLFEAPTIIRYEKDQVLKPHYDANRAAEEEDAVRGGQTLATLIVYLNDVDKGGLTRFGKLPSASSASSASASAEDQFLTVQPKMGDALLFFPADRDGNFDDRLEHEGCPALDEKWIARIWRHANPVLPPYGLTVAELAKL